MLRQSRERKSEASAPAAQQAELFLLAADTPERLAAKASAIAARASAWSRAEFASQARESACKAKKAGEYRAAVVAANPAKLSAALQSIAADPLNPAAVAKHAAFTGRADTSQRVVFVFPGSNRPVLKGEAAWRQRFWECRTTAAELDQHRHATLPAQAAKALTSFEASFAGWRLMQRCNIEPTAVIGVGSGELLACAASGVADEEDLLPLAVASATEGGLNGMLCQVAFDDPLTPLFSASTGMQV